MNPITLRNTNRKKAFTLIELLVVILILAVLAAMVVPKLLGQADKAKIAAARSDVSVLSGAIETFRLNVGRYPTTEEGLTSLRQQPSNADGWAGPYMDKDIAMDPWNKPYIYQSPGNHGDDSYLVGTYGPSGQANAPDSIVAGD